MHINKPRSGKAFIKRGKGDKARIVPLNATVREAVSAIRPVVAEGAVFRGKRGARGRCAIERKPARRLLVSCAIERLAWPTSLVVDP